MGIKEIEEKIISEAEEKALEIKKKCDLVVSKIRDEALTKADAIKVEFLARGKKLAEEEKRSIVIPARLEAKKRVLEEKRRILDSALAAFPEKHREEKEIEVAKILYG
ncbi:MAG: hypothetical protein WC527_01875 [Candidatus Margulisiibacteriota bacterium]